jgi:acetolactate synthase-1/3 small subunit
MQDRYIIVMRVRNRPGVVSRVSGLFTRRGYNIESLATGTTSDASVYQLTVSVLCGADDAELLTRQLERLADTISVRCAAADSDSLVATELMLIRIACAPERREEAERTAALLSARIVKTAGATAVVEVSGGERRLEEAVRAFSVFGILETVRTGTIGLQA